MKYNSNNKPLQCMMTQSTCYKGTSKMTIKGILWHSTGANNPTLKRYVQPSEGDSNYNNLISLLGKNQYGNDWNHISYQAGLNAWIGKLADGTVTTVQTMPWDYKPWGCGSGSNGSCNNGWIQFEICEDNLEDKNYFNTAYKEACELTAYLCKLYNINPKGTTTYNGITVPTILCHYDSYHLGLGSNHGDVYNWFNKYNKTMDSVRSDVSSLLNLTNSNSQTTNSITKTPEEFIKNIAPYIQKYTKQYGFGNSSAVIAQACLESAYGTSSKAKYHNYFGLKYRENRVACASGYFTDGSQEEYTPGVITAITDKWFKFDSMEKGVEGYFQFINNSNYANLKGITNPKTYLENIKKDGYATGTTYVNDVYSVVTKYNLTQYDAKENTAEEKVMSNYDKYINSTGTHYISNSGSDENGSYAGGSAGDQTGNEWTLRSWYNRPWDCVLRYEKDARVGQKLAELGCAAALNNKIGYDQNQRDTYWNQLKANGYDPSKITTACESDCSAGVIANTKAVGYILGIPALQQLSATYTGNMKNGFKNAGFTVLTGSTYTASTSKLLPGDILLNEAHHTATNITKGGSASATTNTQSSSSDSSLLKKGATGNEVKLLQTMLIKLGYSCGSSGADGDFGTNTYNALIAFQKANGLEADGVYGPLSKMKLEQLYKGQEVAAQAPISAPSSSYKVKVTADALNIRSGPGTDYNITGVITDKGIYTIKSEKNNWGQLKSGMGWISLKFTQKV